MDESIEDIKRAARTREHVGNVDHKIASPSERATLVWNYLRIEHSELTDWDLICFSVEFLGAMVPVHAWLEDDVKKVSKLVYTAHYLTPDVDVDSAITKSPSEPVNPAQGRDASPEREVNSDRVIRTRFTFGGRD